MEYQIVSERGSDMGHIVQRLNDLAAKGYRVVSHQVVSWSESGSLSAEMHHIIMERQSAKEFDSHISV